MTDLIGIINLLSGITQIGLGLFVLFSDFKNKVKRYYFFSVFFLGLWSLCIFFYSNPILFDTTIWLKIVYTAAYCMTLGLILFARVYPEELKKKFKTFLLLIGSYMLVMTIIMWFTNLVVVDTQNISGDFNSIATMGRLYFFYGLPEFITAIYIVGYYIRQAKILKGIEKRQVQLYVVGGIVMLVPVLLFDFIFPLVFGDTSFYKYGTIGNSIWTIIVGYSILTTRFLDTRVLVGSFIQIVLKAVIILISFLLVIFLVVPLWDIDFSFIGVVKLAIVSGAISLILAQTFKWVDQFLSEKIVYTRYHPISSLKVFQSKNAETVKMEDISENLLTLISNSFDTDFASVVILDRKDDVLVEQVKGRWEAGIQDIVSTLRVWRKLNSNRVLIYSELVKDKRAGKRIIDSKRDEILSFMKKYGIEIIFSLKEAEKFNGAVIIGEKYNQDSYTVGDIDFLESVMQSTHMALVRAALYQQLESFNKTLQDKVNEQTKELQIKVMELEEARKKERDMIDIMGHELRTPATVVKLNVELLQKYVDSNPDEFKRHLGRIRDAIDTEIKLINTLLSSAKLEGNKIDINSEQVDILQEIDMCIHGHVRDAKLKKLKLINKAKKRTPLIYADKARIIEVLNNLIDNGIKYTERGSVTVKTEYDKEKVTVSVEDTGHGIPKDELSKLGKKFYRVDNYIEGKNWNPIDIVRPGGTGLGLYVTFSLVKLMKGKIWVESKLGKGSKFIFTVPLYKGQDTKKKRIVSLNMFERMGLKK